MEVQWVLPYCPLVGQACKQQPSTRGCKALLCAAGVFLVLGCPGMPHLQTRCSVTSLWETAKEVHRVNVFS